MLKIEINTEKYKWVWGKKPMGRNNWLLKVKINYQEVGTLEYEGKLNKAEVKRAILKAFPIDQVKNTFTKVDVEVVA